MRPYTLYFWIGTWLLVVPFLGVPGNWKDSFVIATALFLLVYAAILMRYTHREEGEEASIDEAIEEEGDSDTNQE